MSLENILSIVTLVYLLGYTFFPDLVRVDKFTLSLLAFLCLFAIMPTLSSGSISYLFSFKRSLKAVEKAVERATGKKSDEKKESSLDSRGSFFATSQIKERLREKLQKLQQEKLKPEERVQPADALRLTINLKHQKIITRELAEAIEKIINTCDVVDYDSKITLEEIKTLAELTTPVLEVLEKR